ncbi:MAG TPA: DUF4142 domain-containing protein [Rhizomicrobium sp.]|nr:DUF4142 domain-containing protein [Rhizomicrobium sp.]
MKLSICLLGAALVLVPAAVSADSPREFLNKAAQGDNSEIMLGRLAQNRGMNPGVRDFGRTLVADHMTARDDVERTARRMGIRVDRDTTFEARNERDRLNGMRGPQFDREFIRYMIDDHRKDINDFREEARERHGGAGDLARRQLPTLQKHLDLALSLNDRIDRNVGWDRRNYRDRDHDRYGR